MASHAIGTARSIHRRVTIILTPRHGFGTAINRTRARDDDMLYLRGVARYRLKHEYLLTRDSDMRPAAFDEQRWYCYSINGINK